MRDQDVDGSYAAASLLVAQMATCPLCPHRTLPRSQSPGVSSSSCKDTSPIRLGTTHRTSWSLRDLFEGTTHPKAPGIRPSVCQFWRDAIQRIAETPGDCVNSLLLRTRSPGGSGRRGHLLFVFPSLYTTGYSSKGRRAFPSCIPTHGSIVVCIFTCPLLLFSFVLQLS